MYSANFVLGLWIGTAITGFAMAPLLFSFGATTTLLITFIFDRTENE